MALLTLLMPPAQAAALLVVPAIGTNIWQMVSGPALGRLLRRFAGMIAATFVGTFLTIGLLTHTGALAPAILGAVLALYGLYGLAGRRFQLSRGAEHWASPLVGLITGMLTGATGVYVIPTMPYLTSLALERDELVQAIGIVAFVCPLALGLALAVHGRFHAEAAAASLVALVPALTGMYFGQRWRRRLPAATFMRAFFAALVVLGGYTFLRAW